MKTQLFYLFLFILYFASCSHSRDNAFVYSTKAIVRESPKDTCHLNPDKVIFGDGLFGAGHLCFVNDNHIVLTLRNSSFQFRLYDFEANSFIDFFTNGNGPGELNKPTVSNIVEKNDTLFMDLLGINERKLVSIAIKDDICEQKPILYSSIELPANTINAYKTDSKLICRVLFDELIRSFQVFTPDGTKLIDVYPYLGAEPYVNSYMIFYDAVQFKADGSMLAMPMDVFDKIHFLNLEDTSMSFSITSSHNTPSDLSIISDAEQKHSTEDFVCIRQSYSTNTQIFVSSYHSGLPNYSLIQSIQVFDWDGNYEKEITFDEPLHSFVISNDERYLFGLTEDEVIYRYKL